MHPGLGHASRAPLRPGAGLPHGSADAGRRFPQMVDRMAGRTARSRRRKRLPPALTMKTEPRRHRAVRRRLAFVAAPLALACAAASADPGYYVVTVYDEPGVRTLDFRYWTVKRPG